MSNMNIQEYKDLLAPKSKTKRNAHEERECKDFHYRLKCMLHYGEIPKVFGYTHSPNERFNPGGKASGKFYAHLAKLEAMGVRKGYPDYVFHFKDNKGVLYLEFKTWTKDAQGKTVSKGYLTPEQKLFQQECLEFNIPYHVVYSKEEAIEILQSHIKLLYINL